MKVNDLVTIKDFSWSRVIDGEKNEFYGIGKEGFANQYRILAMGVTLPHDISGIGGHPQYPNDTILQPEAAPHKIIFINNQSIRPVPKWCPTCGHRR